MPLSLAISMLLRIGLSAVIGISVGLERGLRKKEAGQRTHCIIALGACTFTLISVYGFADVIPFTDFDPTHLAAWVVSGVSFLCSGIIYKSETAGISGLSTATGLWATAALGIACGLGQYLLSVGVALFIILFHLTLNMLHMESFGYTVQTVRLETDSIETVYRLLRARKKKYRARLLSYEYTKNEDRNTITVAFRFRMLGNIPLEDIMEFLDQNQNVCNISV